MRPGKRPFGNAPALSGGSGTPIMLRGTPKRAARAVRTSTESTIIVSVRRLQRPGPASLPMRSRFSRPSAAQSGTGLGGGSGGRVGGGGAGRTKTGRGGGGGGGGPPPPPPPLGHEPGPHDGHAAGEQQRHVEDEDREKHLRQHERLQQRAGPTEHERGDAGHDRERGDEEQHPREGRAQPEVTEAGEHERERRDRKS